MFGPHVFFQIFLVQSANRRCFNPFICHEICAKTVVWRCVVCMYILLALVMYSNEE
jgi:hypothetical protein